MGDLKTLIDLLKPYKSSKKPIVVHCSAGCGRTGTFIALCNLATTLDKFKELAASGKKIDTAGYDLTPRLSIVGTVRRLREQRWSLVKTETQYKSIYEFLKFYCSV